MAMTSEGHTAKLQRLQQLSYFLDNAIPIPGTSYRIGLDPILGLLPGAGDFLTGILSIYIVFSAAQLGASREILIKMVSNIILDTFLGAVPVAGDVFDVAWKANAKNMAILKAHLKAPPSGQKVDGWFVVLLLIGLILITIAISGLSVMIIRWSMNAFKG